MTPKTIQPYFEITQQAKDGGNHIIEGMLTCCNAHAFEVFAASLYFVFKTPRREEGAQNEKNHEANASRSGNHFIPSLWSLRVAWCHL